MQGNDLASLITQIMMARQGQTMGGAGAAQPMGTNMGQMQPSLWDQAKAYRANYAANTGAAKAPIFINPMKAKRAAQNPAQDNRMAMVGALRRATGGEY